MQALLQQPELVQNAVKLFKRPAANNIVRLTRAAGPVNNIVRFARPALVVGKGVLAAKAAALVAAFGVGYLIGTGLRQLWEVLNKPQPKIPAPTYEPVEGSFDIEIPQGLNAALNVTYVIHSQNAQKFWCSTGKPATDPQPPWTEEKLYSTYAKDKASLKLTTTRVNSVCQGDQPGGAQWVLTEMLGLDIEDYKGRPKHKNVYEWYDGTVYESAFTEGFSTKYIEIKKIEFDGEPVPNPVPQPAPLPQPRPEPVFVPEVEPEMLPALPPTKQPSPIVVPADPPDAVPVVEPTPTTTPKPAPVPIRVPVITPATPIPLPDTREITITGELQPPGGDIVKVTPPSVHLFGNAGGRVSGITASLNPMQTAQEISRIEQKLAQLNQNNLSDMDFEDWFNLFKGALEILSEPTAGTVYSLQSVCECDPEDLQCEEEIIRKVIPAKLFGDASIARLDAIAELLQPLKSWKQPICNEKPKLEGDWRTISFISDQTSPYGSARLRKRFRYRSRSGTDLPGLVNHWKDFVWQAGPVCVQHSGCSWGTPQVWAASVDEGKRVIQHAGREAGIDPSEVGKWTVSGSSNPRFGVSGTMRVNTKGGYYWITERLGSDNRPQVMLT